MASRWAHQVEQCFQDRLLALMRRYKREGMYHDPIMCLGWEREAALEMNYCYNQSSVVHQLLPEDIKTMMSKFRIGGDYYDSMVDRGLPVVVKGRPNSALAAELVKITPMVRIIFCIKANKYVHMGEENTSHEDYIRTVHYKIDSEYSLPLSSFHYGGKDEMQKGQPCDTHQPPGININSDGFHLVSLFVENSRLRPELERSDRFYFRQSGSTIIAAMYELTSSRSDSTKPPRGATECGDGRRQATEECDYGGNSAEGCSIDCRVQDKYDCGTARMQPSLCKLGVCGDGTRTHGEVCDDRNLQDGDGCDSSCEVEMATHTCSKIYNRTSSCTLQIPSQANQVAPVRRARSSFKQALALSSRAAAPTQEPSETTLQPLMASSASSRSVSISWMVPCALVLLSAILVLCR